MNRRFPKPIETLYNGYRFRSRTEARWAVFMDSLNIVYVYEKEGYDLGDIGWYLPDFWLPKQNCWLEIKPGRATEKEWRKVQALAKQTGKMAFIFYECSPVVYKSDGFYTSSSCPLVVPINGGHYYAPDGDWDGRMEFGICRICNNVCIGHFGGHQIFCTKAFDYKGNCKGEINIKEMHPRLVAAYTAARSARFEHGEGAKGIW